jgi:hypothetical protein
MNTKRWLIVTPRSRLVTDATIIVLIVTGMLLVVKTNYHTAWRALTFGWLFTVFVYLFRLQCNRRSAMMQGMKTPEHTPPPATIVAEPNDHKEQGDTPLPAVIAQPFPELALLFKLPANERLQKMATLEFQRSLSTFLNSLPPDQKEYLGSLAKQQNEAFLAGLKHYNDTFEQQLRQQNDIDEQNLLRRLTATHRQER